MAVASPCTNVCRFDGKTGFCVGCLRSRVEVREWKKITDHKRHLIINEQPRREKKLGHQTTARKEEK